MKSENKKKNYCAIAVLESGRKYYKCCCNSYEYSNCLYFKPDKLAPKVCYFFGLSRNSDCASRRARKAISQKLVVGSRKGMRE